MTSKEHPILFNADMVREILDGRKTQTRRPVQWPKSLWFDAGGYPFQGGGYTDCRAVEASDIQAWITSPFGVPGDRLWVRESYWHQRLMVEPWYPGHYAGGEYIDDGYDWEFAAPWMADTKPGEAYAEDFGPLEKHLAYGDEEPTGDNWERRPSIHMPRWASRITLDVKAVWVERVQDISEVDAIAEGLNINSGMFFPSDFLPCPECGGDGVHAALVEDYGVTEVECKVCDTPQKAFKILWDSIYAKKGFGWDANPWVFAADFEQQEIP